MSRRIVLLTGLTVAVLGMVVLPSAAGLTPANAESGAVTDSTVTQTTVDCSACHDDEAKVNFPNSDVCTQCHVVTGLAYQKSVHSEKTDTHAQFTCLECHEEPEDSWFMHFQRGPHGEQMPGVTNAPEATCSQSMCHDDSNPFGPVYAEWNETADEDWADDMLSHSKPAPSAVRTEECSACHGTHEGTFANIEAAPGVDSFALGEQPDPDTVEEWRITCSACHDPHSIRQNDVLRGDFESEGELCAQCHTGDIGADLEGPQYDQLHQPIWHLYSQSDFADADGRHPELACSSCHMAAQPRTESFNAKTGHSFEVNTALLSDTDRLLAPESEQCGACHQDLAGTIGTETAQLGNDLTLAARMRSSAETALAETGLEADDQLVADLQAGSRWLDFVQTPEAGVHNPALARDRLRDAISTFDEVKSRAYTQGDGEMDDTPTTTRTPTPTQTTTTAPTQTTTTTETPGFGVGIALIGLLGGALVGASRRR